MLADSFKRKNADGDRVEVEGAARDAIYAQIEADPKLSIVKEDADAAALLASFNVKVEEMRSVKVGRLRKTCACHVFPGTSVQRSVLLKIRRGTAPIFPCW